MSVTAPALRQLDLFSEVLHAYSVGGEVDNASLYAGVLGRAGISAEILSERVPVGQSGQKTNLLTRKLRWYQQTLKHAGVIERVPGERGVWRLCEDAGKDLHRLPATVSVVGFSTDLGVAIIGSAAHVFAQIDAPIVLCLTSPPYALAKERRYGNPSVSHYVDWICTTLEPLVRNLVRGGSIALNIGNDVFVRGTPARELLPERLTIALHDRLGLSKMDTLIWHNPSKAPGPVQWASINRVQLNVAYEPILWLTNDPRAVRADNRRVLQEHSERHLRLIQRGGEDRERVFSDGAYRLHAGSFGAETPGRIPRNVLTFGHGCRDQQDYKRAARARGLPVHGAPMPLSLASFLVEYLTQPGDVVADPFGGSFTTARAAERLGRRWLSTDIMVEYVVGAAHRFRDAGGFHCAVA